MMQISKTINDFIEGAGEILIDGGYNQTINAIRNEYKLFLCTGMLNFIGFGEAYGNAVINLPREEITRKLNEKEQRFLSDILQKVLMISAHSR